jgi:DNA-binding NtrC family response regulator
MLKPVILIAEGNSTLRQNLRRQLGNQGYDITEVVNRETTFEAIRSINPDLVLLGSWGNGEQEVIQAAQEIHSLNRNIGLLLIVAHGSEELAFGALRAGVNDYLKTPYASEELLGRVNNCLAHKVHLTSSTKCGADLVGCDRLIGESTAMRLIKSYISRSAVTDSTVLITGESGTGKELVSDLIHTKSPRNGKPFIWVNCAALPDSLLESELFGYERGAFTGAITAQRGKFELANEGTILLDEIGDMSSYAQAKILRTIESKEIYRLGGKKGISLNVRIVAATNQDLETLIKEKKFRLDLYYRLNVARIHLPPLRERKDDIVYLLDHYVKEANGRFGRSVEGFTEEALAHLVDYDWPGNVRELKNLCDAIFINLPAKKISLLDLPYLYQNRLKEVEPLPRVERERLLSALFTTNWNVSKAARRLNWSRMTIYRKLKKYHLRKPPAAEDAVAKGFRTL